MMSPNKILTLVTLVTTLTISDFPLIQNPKSQILNSQVLAQSVDERKAEGDRLFQQGSQQYGMSQFEAALQSLQQALIIYREIKDHQREGIALSNLGITYYALGDYGKAIEYHQQSLAIAERIKDREGEGVSLGSLGNAYFSQGDYGKAIESHQQSLAIAREIKYPQLEGASLGSLGGAYYALGDYGKAIEYYQQSLAIAREIKDRQSEGASLGDLGNAYYSLGDYAKAIEYSQQYLAIAKNIDDLEGEGTALNNLGVALQKSGNLTQAEKILRTGIEVWESLRRRLGDNDTDKVSIFEQQARTYRVLQQVLIAQNKPDAALEIAERGRARAFLELLARRNTTTSDSANSPIAPPTIEQLQQVAKQQNATLVEYSITYDEFKIKGKEEWKESELYIWVIKPTGEITFRRSDLKPLWQQQDTSLKDFVTSSRESIGVRSRGLGVIARVDEESQTNRLKQLHQILIQPIANLLPTNPEARVIFMPQSSLFLVPFPALKDEQGKYLIEKHTILTAPSIQVLELTRKQRENLLPLTKGGTGGVNLVVGNPTMPSVPPYPGEKPQQLAPLPGAEAEAKASAPLLN